jgi:hypothetical protein
MNWSLSELGPGSEWTKSHVVSRTTQVIYHRSIHAKNTRNGFHKHGRKKYCAKEDANGSLLVTETDSPPLGHVPDRDMPWKNGDFHRGSAQNR